MADPFGGQATAAGGTANVCIRCGSRSHTTRDHDEGKHELKAGGGASPSRQRPAPKKAGTGMRTRNVKGEEKRALLEKIARVEKEMKAEGRGGDPIDRGITAFQDGRRVKAKPGGSTKPPEELAVGQREEVIVRRYDGGRRVPLLTEPWHGAPIVHVERRGAQRGESQTTSARVPAYLANGEEVVVDEEPGWRLRHAEFVRVRRVTAGKTPCSGYVPKCHLVGIPQRAQHESGWVGTQSRPDLEPFCKTRRKPDFHRDTRGYPKRELRWEWVGKTYRCDVRLTGARDTPDGGVCAAPPTYEDKEHCADLISGFYPYAVPTHVVVCPR
eukprot:Sspe_Gene.36646::Locus_17708_Transcript_1_1_Confidence_1.000_Length_1102::g.36646::m.36646